MKIIDFGLSKKSELFYSNSGTREFAAPEYYVEGFEQSKNRSIDIWALGCTLFCLLTARKPFLTKNKNNGEMEFDVKKLKNGDLELDRYVNDEDCKKIIRMCVRKDPSRRVDAKNLLKVIFF